jgi:transcriptional regulator with XRE-family HTH domain
MESTKNFGETIKELREEKKLPLREVAQAMGIDTSMLSKIEKNNRKPNLKLIEKLAGYFNLESNELLITFLSDSVAYKIMDQQELSFEVLKAAEAKVKYLKTKSHLEK